MLELSSNKFTGQFIEIDRLQNLRYLDVSDNLLTGQLTDSICNIEVIRMIDVSDNLIEGDVPECYNDLIDLKILSIRGNNFQDFQEWLITRFPSNFL